MLQKLKCRHIRRLLSERTDAPLGKAQESRVRAHLTHCRACRREAAYYRQIKTAAAGLEKYQAPAYLWDRIAVQLDEHPWGEENHVRAIDLKPGWMRTISGKINFAGALVSFALIMMLCLIPGITADDNDLSAGHNAVASEYDPGLEYVSIYMMANPDRFPYEIRDYYINQFESLDRQIKTIKATLEKFPGNQAVMKQLASAYGQKIALYREVGHQPPRRMDNLEHDQAGYRFDRGNNYE